MEFVAAEVTEVTKIAEVKVEPRIEPKVEAEPKTEIKVETKVETPTAKPTAAPRSPQGRLSTGFSLKDALSKGSKGGSDEEGEQSQSTAARKIDPATEQKLNDKLEAIVNFIASTRPRFKPLFETMKITAEAIELTVPTTDVELELRRTELEIMAKIIEMADVKGFVELRITVDEEVSKSSRPLKLEDRVAHFSNLNPLIAELTKALDLQVDN
ncbi:MAG: DNA polymerase III subunit gamma/tau [Rikenellaceae bacterium]